MSVDVYVGDMGFVAFWEGSLEVGASTYHSYSTETTDLPAGMARVCSLEELHTALIAILKTQNEE